MNAWLRLQTFAFRSGMSNWVAEPLGHVLNTLVLALALALPWCVWSALSALAPAINQAVGKPEVSLFFELGTRASTVEQAAAQLQGDVSVLKVVVINPADALERLKNQSQSPELAEALPDNPLPYTVVVTLDIDAETEPAKLEKKIAQWRMWSHVEHVQYDAQWVRKLKTVLQTGQWITVALGLLVAGMVLVVTFNTVRLQLVQHQTEIEVLRALGATDSEVGRPTLWWSLSLAVMAFALAFVVVWATLAYMDHSAGNWIRQFDSRFVFRTPSGSGTTLLLAAWVAWVMMGAWLSVRVSVWRLR